jgi:DNA-binding NarL/FixJ family response regulator
MSASSQRAMPRVDILIVDDHQIFAEVLAMRLEEDTNVRSVTLAGSLAAARSRIRALGEGIILLDYHLGDESGLDLLADIARLGTRPKVVVLSASKEPAEIVRALRAGVDAWLVKTEGYDVLVEVTADAYGGVMHLPASSLREVVMRLLGEGQSRPGAGTFVDSLSTRELQVLRHLVAGLSRDEIAKRMFLSPHTVRTHVQHLLRRADVHSTVALVARARAAGVTALPQST